LLCNPIYQLVDLADSTFLVLFFIAFIAYEAVQFPYFGVHDFIPSLLSTEHKTANIPYSHPVIFHIRCFTYSYVLYTKASTKRHKRGFGLRAFQGMQQHFMQKAYTTPRADEQLSIKEDKLSLDTSAIILAGGLSTRFRQDKGLLPLVGKPLVGHVLDAVDNIANERMVVTSSETQAKAFTKALGSNVRVVMDRGNLHSPLAGALAGFEKAAGTYSFLLPCDTPLVSREILSLLLDLSVNKTAVIPRWPNCFTEPLQAVYHTKSALEASMEAFEEGNMTMQSMVNKLLGVRYVSTLVLQQLDPELNTFLNVNAPLDLKKAENLLKRRKR
jgi:molybdopterin-guanine dinucleotide biosynthesis protein A